MTKYNFREKQVSTVMNKNISDKFVHIYHEFF